MKLFTLISLMLLGFAQFITAQDLVETPRQNSMSNVFGLTAEAGVTLGFTDYSTYKFNYTGKASLEYYLPSTGNGNFGLRAFGQTGFISGKNPPPNSGNPTNEFSTKIDMYGGGVFYTLSIDNAVYPWAAIGVSNLWFYPKDANGNALPNYTAQNYKKYMLAYNGDAGVRIMVSKNVSVNITGGIIVGSKDYLDDIKSGPNNDMLYTATVGLTYYFGRDKDSDGDGVPDYMDDCPNTPAGVKVDATGCPLDSDGDGVPDYLDKCPNTPLGVKVDANGCPLDSDGDGVPDYLDKCPNTPAGVKVDATGCPLDSDGDGVPDYLDKCPNTPMGVQVDSEGCPIKKETKDTVVITQPAEIESLVLSGDANFEFNKSKLLSNAYAVLDSLVRTMKEHPEYKWEVGGYTDGIGSANYNIKLSQRRAQSVVDYLVSQGVERNNLKIVGYGKDNPIATNETAEGRAMNRRVEIKLLSKGN
ncbi:MAG: OmpA family protein [Ignavibacteriaceae bacterium]